MKAYTATIYARPGTLLLGGVKRVTSTPFEFEHMTHDWLYAASDQPNYSHSHIKEVNVPKEKVILASQCK